MTDRMTGTIKYWNAEKGFGFINPDGFGDSVFCHFSQIRKTGLSELPRGQRVTYETGPDRNGRQMAVNLECA